MAKTTSQYDYIIVGGGIAGSVVASRLHERLPHLSILLIEAGPSVAQNPLVTEIKHAFAVLGSDIDWSYASVPQKHLNNRVTTSAAGKCLGGGSAINFFGWVRGDANDYNAWAKVVGDERWSYDRMLPYFRKTEYYCGPGKDEKQHGYEGPLYTQSVTSSGRKYPLREKVLSAWNSAGVQFNPDGNSGSPQGISELVENLNDGARQVSSTVYPLEGVTVMTSTLVASIVLETCGPTKTAKGVRLADGRIFAAKEEVILSAGAIATPQILLLSGIGPANELASHGIEQLVDAPEVGKNLHGHMCASQWWELRNPDQGLSVGSANFNADSLIKGFPGDWVITQTVPHDGLKKALATDDDLHPLLYPPRSHYEAFLVYVAANPSDPFIPRDGTHLTTTVMGLLPTSRGSIRLASRNPGDPPIFDPNYYATEADRFVIRTALRKVTSVMTETTEGRAMVKAQGGRTLSSQSSDSDIDELVRERGNGISHTMGTAAMGTVVASDLKVVGLNGLRIVDASVIPVPIASHIQACVYALAEQAVDIIVAKKS